ncbi:MAG: phosphoribosyl-ATP diphosphatase [Pseudomonadota bacterium]
MSDNDPFLYELEGVIRQRLNDPDTYSYTARLAAEGLPRVAQKVGEEAVEVAIASVSDKATEGFRAEVADLVFHLLVLLAVKEVSLAEITTLLRERHESRRQPD